tara:strand:- start:731 stop:1777 length:1047 start_codon:yes stop_codon:yes gene_type:complete
MTSISRQQRRAAARKREAQQERQWRNLRRNRSKGPSLTYLDHDAFLPFFGNPNQADLLCPQVDGALVQLLKGAEIPRTGLRIKVRFLSMMDTQGKKMEAVIVGSSPGDPGQSSHVALMGYFDEAELPSIPEGAGQDSSALHPYLNDVTSEIRLPFEILLNPELPKKPMGTSWLYQIRFNTAEALAAGTIDKAFGSTLGHGYVGVTARPFVKRMIEHFRDMKADQGHLLHATWRGLRENEIPHRTIAQISGWSLDEDEIYAMEEAVVEPNTLAPKGLNMIPGGRNGIAALADMGFVANMETRDRVLGEAIRRKAAGLPFFRRPHIREYKPGKFTNVSGCWVRPGSAVEM